MTKARAEIDQGTFKLGKIRHYFVCAVNVFFNVIYIVHVVFVVNIDCDDDCIIILLLVSYLMS